MKKIMPLLIASAVLLSGASTLMISQTADARPAATKSAKQNKETAKPKLNAVLGKLQWGMDVDKSKQIIADMIMESFRKKTEGNTDLSYVDNVRKAHLERVENMQKSYMVLTRENASSLGVSIVGEEFEPDKNESLISQREDIATKYYFFKDNQLYKLAVVYDSTYMGGVSFDAFCATTAEKYGPSSHSVTDADGMITEEEWTDSTDVKLIVKNKFSSYSTFLMVFANESVESKLNAEHKAYFASLNAGPSVSSAIDALTEDSSGAGSSSVDALLGKQTKVDLLAGLSQEDVDIINGKTTEKEIEKAKKAKAKKAKKARKDDAKAKQGLEIF